MEEDILNYLPTLMFRGTPCTQIDKWNHIMCRKGTNKDETENWNILKFLFSQDLPDKGDPWSLENLEFLLDLNIPGLTIQNQLGN